MKTEYIPVFFTIDNDFTPYLSVAIHSMVKNASKDRKYTIIVIYEDLTDENRKKIISLLDNNFNIRFVAMGDRLNWMSDRIGNRLRADFFTLTIYFRLFIPEMFPEYDKGIYLDSDIVIPGDISELYDIELGDDLVGAVVDHSILNIPSFVKYVEKAIGIDRYKYINSGIQLMNMKGLREVKSNERFLNLMQEYGFDCIAPDQDYLNAMASNRIHHLPLNWDAMPTEGNDMIKNPKLIHYNLFWKPWHYDGVQYEEYFWEYAKTSGFYEQILDVKSKYSDIDKESDEESLKLMLSRAEEISESQLTFRSVFESGKESKL